MENIVNTRLFSLSNVLAIGAVMFFWAALAYALEKSFTS
jgi:hypothetical protein